MLRLAAQVKVRKEKVFLPAARKEEDEEEDTVVGWNRDGGKDAQ